MKRKRTYSVTVFLLQQPTNPQLSYFLPHAGMLRQQPLLLPRPPQLTVSPHAGHAHTGEGCAEDEKAAGGAVGLPDWHLRTRGCERHRGTRALKAPRHFPERALLGRPTLAPID